MILPAVFSLFLSVTISSSFVYGQVLDQQNQDPAMQLLNKVVKKIQKTSEVSLICVQDALKGYGLSDECMRWHLTANAKLNELFNETKTDTDTILYN